MNCPKCRSQLNHETINGVKIERCSQCQGIWLITPDIETLEDRAFETQELESSTIFDAKDSHLTCSLCQNRMKKVIYGSYDLQLIFCPRHGYWIDQEEEERLLDLFQKQANKVATVHPQEQWVDLLIQLKSPNFWSRLALL